MQSSTTATAGNFFHVAGARGTGKSNPVKALLALDLRLTVPVLHTARSHDRWLALTTANVECNLPEPGVMGFKTPRVRSSRLLLVPASAETRGLGTKAFANFFPGAAHKTSCDRPRGRP